MAVDLTVVHLCAPSAVPFGSGAARAEKLKRDESAALCAASGVAFSPFVMDFWGGLHGAAKGVWQQLTAKATSGRTGVVRTAELGRLRQGLAVRVVCAVADQLEHLLTVTADPPVWFDEQAGPPSWVDELGNELDWPRSGWE